jgi:hypothetical protein
MAHDATKVVMGSSRSSFKNVDNRAGSIAAGLAVRLKSDDTISVAAADGNLLGISLGRSLSDTARTAIVRKGTQVPIQVTGSFTPTIGAQVAIHDTTGKAATKDGSSTYVNAVYVSSALTMIDEDGAETSASVALIDFPGGL